MRKHDGTITSDLRNFMLSNDSTISTEHLARFKTALEGVTNCFFNFINEYLVCFDNDDANAKGIRETNSDLHKILNFIFYDDSKVLNGT